MCQSANAGKRRQLLAANTHGGYGSDPPSNFNSPPPGDLKFCQAQQVCGEMMCPLCTTENTCKSHDSCDYDASGICSLKCLPAGQRCNQNGGPQCCPGNVCEYDDDLYGNICIEEVILKANGDQCSDNATCNSKNCTNGICMCTLGATSNQATCSASKTQSACEENGCFYDTSMMALVPRSKGIVE